MSTVDRWTCGRCAVSYRVGAPRFPQPAKEFCGECGIKHWSGVWHGGGASVHAEPEDILKVFPNAYLGDL